MTKRRSKRKSKSIKVWVCADCDFGPCVATGNEAQLCSFNFDAKFKEGKVVMDGSP